MLNSINPLFDNIEFKEFLDRTEDLFLMDQERQDNIGFVDASYEQVENQNVVFGNRNSLMFIQQYHEVYKRQSSAPPNSAMSEIERYRRAMLAVQCGDYMNSEPLLERIASETSSKFKDFLWLRFRTQAQRILIS